MEKWKLAVIATLVLALFGFGIAQQNADKARLANPQIGPTGTPIPSVYIGKTLPAWNFKTWSGPAVSPESLKGQPAFIEIFRTGCSHCNDAAPFISALNKRYTPRGLEMMAIQSPADPTDATNPENRWGDVQSWIKKNNVQYPVALDEGSKWFQGKVKSQILGGDEKKLLYPSMMLTDKAGKVDFAQTGFDTAKAIALAVELEKRFPGAGDANQNAADLAKFLGQSLPELQVDGAPLQGAQSKAFTDDLAQQLQP